MVNASVTVDNGIDPIYLRERNPKQSSNGFDHLGDYFDDLFKENRERVEEFKAEQKNFKSSPDLRRLQ